MMGFLFSLEDDKEPEPAAVPEPAPAEYVEGHLCKLEWLLRFFHSGCKPHLNILPPQSRLKLLAYIKVTAADTFFVAEDPII